MASQSSEETIEFADAQSWRSWLEAHHAEATGVWLRIAKKGAAATTVTHPEALDAAICFGWIDAQRKSSDETYFLQRFCRRKPRSMWSKINRAKAESFVASGSMTPAGLREVHAAQADGRWDAAYDGQRTASVPDDLAAAWERRPKAREFFATLDSRNRYAVLFRIQQAKKPETRAKRVESFVAMLERHESVYPQLRRKERGC